MSSRPAEAPGIALPRAPESPQRHALPLVATVAPVAVSLGMWAITGSPYALAFAVLGPVIAVASLADGRLNGRRHAKREWKRFDGQIASTRQLIDEFHAEERARLVAEVERTRGAPDDTPGDPERWRLDDAAGVRVSLGLRVGRSSIRIEDAASSPDSAPAEEPLAALRAYAADIVDVPLFVDPFLGIGVCGPAALVNAAAREILLQLAGSLPPQAFSLAVPPGEAWQWLRSLPHRVLSAPGGAERVEWVSEGGTALVAVAAGTSALPAECRVVLEVRSGTAARLVRCPGVEGQPIAPVFASGEAALERALFLAAAARARGIGRQGEHEAPDPVFSALPLGSTAESSLECFFGTSEGQPFAVDLVAHGPHAVVGGTTGSGKSELLQSWILAMAASRDPAEVSFLLVDFKGGASFAAIAGLPHVVGVVTDLDERVAARAILSLGAEIRFREAFLARVGARDIGGMPAGERLARLVIVVDEFAAMVVDRPELHALFADLAARGRSLGIHLILCTQRPAGVVRDAVLANARLRISLRVNNAADSVAVVGSAAAAALPAGRPGAAVVSLDGEDARPIRVALVTGDDVRRVAATRPRGEAPLRRPWCDDLPPVVRLSALAVGVKGLPIGLLDLPSEQRQATAAYDAAGQGNLLVVGGHRSGKSNVLRVLASAAAVRVMPAPIDAAWEFLERELAGRPPALVVVDDLDAIVARLPDEYQQSFVEMLLEVLRTGSSTGRGVALTVRRIPAVLHTVAELCDSRLILRLPGRQDHLMAGGEPAGYDPSAPPGRGEWFGNRVQVALAAGEALEPDSVEAPLVDWSDGARRAVVSTTPETFERAMKRAGCAGPVVQLRAGGSGETAGAAVDVRGAGARAVIVGDPDAWQAAWGLAASIRGSASLLFHACTPAEFRAVSGQRRLPPPIVRRSTDCWLLEPDGSLRRVRALPDPELG
ncbi:FtsK/SpoIIIE domain-containing protein [Lacisediminihabitans sp.]|uniref:FtsK/SpoIIIE domain-containing protein n=1 Tax=Lacisediminihabitans sp. TaxID=2787631 RepID=UPI002F9269B0